MMEDQLREISFKQIDQAIQIIIVNSLQTTKQLILLKVILLLLMILSIELDSVRPIPIFILLMEPSLSEDVIQEINMLPVALAIIIRNSRCSNLILTKTQ